MRALATIILLLASLVFCETQDSVYFWALKAEELGDVSGSLSLFEKALSLPGPYTEEIREILKDYYDALGVENEIQNNVSFRFSSDVGLYGLHYNEYGGVHALKERGADFFVFVESFIDFYSNGRLNSFGFSLMTDWFLNNEMKTLDTNDWVFTPSLEFSMISKDFMWDMGLDFKTPEGNTAEISWYNWVEKIFLTYERHSLGVSLWDYLNSEGPFVLAVYATWRRNAPMGINVTTSMGVRFDADSVVVVESFDDTLLEEIVHEPDFNVPMYWGKWLGPNLRLRASYKFKKNISLNVKLNLFYGFVVDWPYRDGNDMEKFSQTWGIQVNWNPSFYTLYFGVEQIILHYNDMPNSYVGLYPKNSFLTEAKIGVKTEF